MNKLFLILLSLFLITGTYAQTIAITTEGKRVVLNNNGTWQFLDNNAPATTSPSTSNQNQECVSQDYGTITVINTRTDAISIDFDHLKQLASNPDYGQSFGNNTKDKRIWKDNSGRYIIPPGETQKFYQIMSGSYVYRIYNSSYIETASGNVYVEQCKESKLEAK